jgi:hypothetical protein
VTGALISTRLAGPISIAALHFDSYARVLARKLSIHHIGAVGANFERFSYENDNWNNSRYSSGPARL